MDGFIKNLKVVAIIGSGVIGRNWAILFAKAGLDVNLYDVSKSQADNALKEINEKLLQYSNKEIGLIKVFNCLADCLLDVQYVQECVPESVEIKKQIFSQLNALLSRKSGQHDQVSHEGNNIYKQSDKKEILFKKGDYQGDDEKVYEQLYGNYIILGSSSSGIPVSQFTQELEIRPRCIIAHPLNPPLYCPLVEIVPACYTSPWVTKITYFLMEKVGQKPIILQKEVFGFAANRIQYALLAECWRLVQDGVLTVTDVDKVMSDGLGLRYAFFGPFHNCHLNAEGIEDYMNRYGPGMQNVISSFETNINFTKKTLEEIKMDMEQKVPLRSLGAGRLKREECLEKISNLKSELGL